MAKKSETPRRELKFKATAVKDVKEDPVVVEKAVVKSKAKNPEPVEEFTTTPPLFIKKKEKAIKVVAEKSTEPVTMEEIEGTMRYLAPRLKDPKTKEDAESELKELHVRIRNVKQQPKW